MKISIRSFAFATLPLLAACAAETSTPAPAPATSATTAPTATVPGETTPAPEAPKDEFELFGDVLDPALAEVPFDSVIKNPEAYKTKVVTTGVVRQNCLKKGCWMDIRSPNDRDSDGLTVRFKDYSFFIPLGSKGASVKMQGVVSVKELTAEEVKHLEDEGAVVAGKRPDGTARSIAMLASGVEMRGRKK